MRIRLPSISFIVARSWPDSIIGRNNQLPWHLRTDLKRFKQLTIGNAVLMGRKTYLSIGKPLPQRVNVVLSRNSEFDAAISFWHREETILLWAENRESALFFADVYSIAKDTTNFFVIGGSEMYRVFADLFNKIYLTEVMTGDTLRREPADAIFDYKIDHRQWHRIVSENVPSGPYDDYPSRFTILERKSKTVRYVDVEDYYTAAQTKKNWIKRQLDLFDDTVTKPGKQPLRVPYQFKLFEERAD